MRCDTTSLTPIKLLCFVKNSSEDIKFLSPDFVDQTELYRHEASMISEIVHSKSHARFYFPLSLNIVN